MWQSHSIAGSQGRRETDVNVLRLTPRAQRGSYPVKQQICLSISPLSRPYRAPFSPLSRPYRTAIVPQRASHVKSVVWEGN